MNTPYQSSTHEDAARDPGGRTTTAPPRDVAESARETVDSLRASAATKVDKLAESAEAAASKLADDDVGQLSQYIHGVATSMSGFARDMREKSGDDMLAQVNRLAREKPAMFIGGSILAGLALSRFARSSRRSTHLPVTADDARVTIRPAQPTSATSTDASGSGSGSGADQTSTTRGVNPSGFQPSTTGGF